MAVLTLALVLDLLLGDPRFIWRSLPHPVVLFGKVIEYFDKHRAEWNFDQLGGGEGEAEPGFTAGLVLLAMLLLLSIGVHFAIIAIGGWLGFVLELIIVGVLIAQKSMMEHVKVVIEALGHEDINKGREAVSQIVGRDVSTLDKSGISKAAIESLAENFSDGVVAPALWYAVLGLPGILFCKALNTADSMIGHRTLNHEYFGKPAAILDDWMNWPAARLSSLLVMLAMVVSRGKSAAINVWEITLRDAPGHRSPNAGWPEASFASALGIRLGGPRSYGEEVIEAVTLNPEGRSLVSVQDINKALRLFLRACLCLIAFCAFVWFLF
ncbi:MAG: adenosylcobinamide-phosphate synthase CbiB [Rhizobiaceae bacterium]